MIEIWEKPMTIDTALVLAWPMPPTNMAACLVDDSFLATNIMTSAGMILRLHDRSVIYAAYKYLFHCNDALEVEIHEMMQGMALTIQHTKLPVLVQSDSSMTLSILFGDSLVRSAYGQLALDIKALIGTREYISQEFRRE